MILITVKFDVLPEHAETWMTHVAEFTTATRAEPGNLWFEWSRSVENPNEFVLLEAFEDDAAEAHVSSDHFKEFTESTPSKLSSTPKIVSRQVEGKGWDEMGEMSV